MRVTKHLPLLGAAALALALVRCGPQAPTPVPDAGRVTPRPDAGTVADAGEAPDAGLEPDAGEAPDAGEPFDAGAEPDAGIPEENPVDAGIVPETPDAGTETPDAGTEVFYWTRVNATPPYDACVGTAWPLDPEIHVPEGEQVTYTHQPPPSGPHWGCWAPWATATRVLPPERFVHNLEHGGIVLLYRCAPPEGGFAPDAFQDGHSPCPEAAAAVQAFLATAPKDAFGASRYVVTAIPDMPHAFAALAWGWSLETDTFDPDAVACFARAHLQQGPEDVASDPYAPSCPQVYPP